MSLDYIRDRYRVPAHVGNRIRFTWNSWAGAPFATITGASGPHLRVTFDSGESEILHPTWEVEYLPEPEAGA